jgi:hypothetical protein
VSDQEPGHEIEPLVIEVEPETFIAHEAPAMLPEVTEIVCDAGVMKIDLTDTELDGDEHVVEIDCDGGVLTVLVPRGVGVHLGDVVNVGGVFRNRVRASGESNLLVHVSNRGGVISIRHPRPWERRRR